MSFSRARALTPEQLRAARTKEARGRAIGTVWVSAAMIDVLDGQWRAHSILSTLVSPVCGHMSVLETSTRFAFR